MTSTAGDGELRSRRPAAAAFNSKDRPTAEELPKESPLELRLSYKHWLIVIVFLAATALLSNQRVQSLPYPVQSSREGQFSESRARVFLKQLAAIGWKPSGSDNLEVKAFKLLVDELKAIQSSVSAQNRLEMDIQRPSGCYDLPKLGNFTLCYKRVVNVVVRFGRRGAPTERSVLVNGHLDSHVTSPGASDDGASVAVMLELLRVLGRAEPPAHDLLFLFNGAEENVLQASHGFITQHPWRHSIRAFVNLEAAGSGGREMLFQAGPQNEWLLDSYLSAAPYPFANIGGQEVFQAGLIPSDTDFRIFRDYGRIPGLDIAWSKNGYVYHTEFDMYRFISNGSLQRAGENLLGTLRHLDASPYLENPAAFAGGKSVFFDYVGFAAIRYSFATASIINYGLVLAVILHILYNCRGSSDYKNGFFLALGSHIISVVAIVAAYLLLASLVTVSGLLMCWYAKPWLVIPIYIMPLTFIGLTSYSAVYYFLASRTEMVRTSTQEKVLYDSHILLNATILCLMTNAGLGCAYVFAIVVLFSSMRGPLFAAYLWLTGRSRLSTRAFLCGHFICTFAGLLNIFYSLIFLFDVFIPIMGRSFRVVNPEFVIGFLAAFLALVICFFAASLTVLSRGMGRVFIYGPCFILIVFIMAIATRVAPPYKYSTDAPRLRRVVLIHTSRDLYGKDGQLGQDEGIFINSQDFRGTDDLPDSFLSGAWPVDCAYTIDAACHVPYNYPVYRRLPPETFLWKRANENLQLKPETRLILLERAHIGTNALNFSVELDGSDHMALTATPLPGWTLKSWSLSDADVSSQNTSFAYLSYGQYDGPYRLWILLTRDPDSATAVDAGEAALLLSLTSHYQHGKQMHSGSLQPMLNAIKTQRVRSQDWRWAITAWAWTSKVVARYL